MDSNSRQYGNNGNNGGGYHHQNGGNGVRTFHADRRLTEWIAPFKRFEHGNVIVDVNKLPLRFPQFSIRVGTIQPDGRTSGFIVYRTDQHASGNPDADMVLDLVAQALDFIKDEMTKVPSGVTGAVFVGPDEPVAFTVPRRPRADVAPEPEPAPEKPKRQRRQRKGGGSKE